MEHSDQRAEHLREMHVRDSESDRIARQCSDDDGCLCTDLIESKNVFDTSTFKLCDPESNLRELKIKCMLVEFDQQAGYELGMSHNFVMQIPQESFFSVSSRVTSHSISGIPLDALSVLNNSFLSDKSGNLLNMILDSGAEGHSGFWIVWSLGRQDENSVCVRGSSLFALKRHDTFDDGAKWILQVDEQRTQWESITSCFRILIGLETSKIVAITLELQFGSRILLKALGIMCMLHSGNDLCNYSPGRSVLCKDSAATLSFVKRSLSDRYDGTMKEMVQRQKDAIFSSGIEFSIKTMYLRHSSWLNHLVRKDFMGCTLVFLEFAFGSVLVWLMTATQRILVWLVGIREGVQKIVSHQATKNVSKRTMRHHKTLHKSAQY